MTENNNMPVPPAPEENKQAQEPQEGELRAELARTRKRSNVMTAVAVSLGMIFVILAGVVYVVYTKISAAKENFEEAFRVMPAPAAGYQPENRMFAGQGIYSSTTMPASSLGMFAGGVPGGPARQITPEDVESLKRAIEKYTERPVMKEFFAELKQNPEVKAAMESAKGGNPMAMIAVAQNAKGVDKLMLRYATRPDFIKTMMEMSNDPALRSLAGGMPVMSGAMPQGQAVSIPTQPAQPAQPADSDGDGEITFDASAISGPAKTTPAAGKKVPSPVDSGQ